MFILYKKSVQESVPNQSISFATMKWIEFRIMTERDSFSRWMFPPYSHVIFDSVDSEETSTNIITAAIFESIAKTSQSTDWDKSLIWCFSIVISNAGMNSFHKS